ncbi:hypothetical protein D3C71_2094530 [compost metagenome]
MIERVRRRQAIKQCDVELLLRPGCGNSADGQPIADTRRQIDVQINVANTAKVACDRQAVTGLAIGEIQQSSIGEAR